MSDRYNLFLYGLKSRAESTSAMQSYFLVLVCFGFSLT